MTEKSDTRNNTQKSAKNSRHPQKDRVEILFQDEYLCVVSKPAGILSVPYPGSRAKTIQSVIEEMMRQNGTFNSKHKPLAVHRLDRETSGVMMFALTENAHKKIMDTWHKMVIERLYTAVAENPRNKKLTLPDHGLIDDSLAFNAQHRGYVPKAEEEKNTVPARTNYKILLQGPTHTLFELSLDTGKKNQIRAHLASKGYPLAGDENYRARTDNFGRLCLHAKTLDFIHPFTGKEYKFEVNEPSEWAEYVKKGDLKPETPSWIKKIENHFNSSRGESFHDHSPKKVELGSKRLTRKDRAHMNFIEAGKSRQG